MIFTLEGDSDLLKRKNDLVIKMISRGNQILDKAKVARNYYYKASEEQLRKILAHNINILESFTNKTPRRTDFNTDPELRNLCKGI